MSCKDVSGVMLLGEWLGKQSGGLQVGFWLLAPALVAVEGEEWLIQCWILGWMGPCALQQGSVHYDGYSISRLLLLLSSPEPFSHPLTRM